MLQHALLRSLVCVVLLGVIGKVSYAAGTDSPGRCQLHFPTSCSAEAQPHFDRAVALLHGFWFPAALKAFTTVLDTDSSCAMAYWGMAMSLLDHPLAGAPTPQALQAGAETIRQGKPVGVRTEREYDYIAAVSLFYKDVDTTEYRSRALAYEQAMAQLTARYPEDSEAAIFYALALNMTAEPTDNTYARQLQAAAILEKIFVQQPQHPGVAHYLLHSYD